MKSNAKPHQSSAVKPEAKPEAVRQEAAQQIRDSELAAKEVTDLCEKALDKARRAHVPHAGVGAPHDTGI